MQREAVEYVARFFTCQEVKAIHQCRAHLLQPIPILEWKWETITMDFTTGLPRTKKKNDSIMAVVDKLSKATHFIPVNSTYRAVNIVDIFMKDIFRLHGILKIVITDCDAKFTSRFWTSYHLQTNV